MNGMKSLWAMVQGDPVFMRRTNGWLTILWVIMIPISWRLGWLASVVYVSALSLWALVSGHWAAWQAARVEVAQMEAEQKQGEFNDELVEKIMKKLEEYGRMGSWEKDTEREAPPSVARDAESPTSNPPPTV